MIFVVILLALAIISARNQESPRHSLATAFAAAQEPGVAANQPRVADGTARSQGKMKWFYDLISWPDGITALAVILTLGGIIWQSSEAKRASENAAAQVKAMMATERAWVVIRSSMDDYRPTLDDQWLFWWQIKNTGTTAARILSTQCRYELVRADQLDSLPLAPEYLQPIELKGFLLAPGDSATYQTFLVSAHNGAVIHRGVLDAGDFNAIQSEALRLRVYGFVRYRDVFDETRESRFCEHYVWPAPNRPSAAVGFHHLISTPPEYTKCT